MNKKSIKSYSFLLSELIKKGIKLKYRRSYLGMLWSLIEPLLTTTVLVVVFGTLFKNEDPNYPMYVIIGRLMYSFFSAGTNATMISFRQNAEIMKKVYIPKLIYPVSTVIYNYIITGISLLVLIPVDIYCGIIPTWHLFQFIPAVFLTMIFTFGTGLILASLNVFFDDIVYLWSVALLLIMYMSAIFYYPEAILESRYSFILNMNPLFSTIQLGRDAFFAQPLNIKYCMTALIWGIGTNAAGLLFFKANKDKFILHL